ncbi:MAG: hypothetical protein P4L92_22095 [Rudaea sp.]|nr:hypothetical protein [Rudaea sp.]
MVRVLPDGKDNRHSKGPWAFAAVEQKMAYQKALRTEAASNPNVRRTGGMIISVIIIFALAAFLYALSWNSVSAGFLSDDAVYLLMADGFSPFRAAEPELIHYVMRQSLFPPFYPLLLAAFGAGSASLLLAHLITTTALVLALLVYSSWTYSETKDRLAAVWLVMIFALSPGTLLQDLEILSEFPYLLFSFLALWLAARNPITARGYGLIALSVGLAALTRTAGFSLILALGMWLFRHRTAGRVKWLALAVAPSLIWILYKTFVIGSQGGYGQLWLWLWEQLKNNKLTEFVPFFFENQSEGLWRGLLLNLNIDPSPLAKTVLGITLLAALPTWIRRLRSWRLDAWYLLVGGAMILLYPFPSFSTRLVLPLVPIVLLYSYLGVLSIASGWGAIRWKPLLAYGFLAALSLTLLPSLGFIAHRFNEPIDPELAAWKHTRYWFRLESMEKITADLTFRQNLIHAAREVRQWVPESDCVFGVHTGIAMLYSRRIFLQPPPPTDGAYNLSAQAPPQACHYFFLMSTAGQIGNYQVDAFYPNDRLPADRVEIVHAWEDAHNAPTAILLRLKPPA